MLTRFDALAVGLMESLRNEHAAITPAFEEEFLQKMGERNVHDRLNELDADNRGLNAAGEEVEGLTLDQKGYNWSVAKFTNDTNRVVVRLNASRAVFAIA